MWAKLNAFLVKIFWPLMTVYGLYFIYQIYAYVHHVKYVVNKDFFCHYTLMKLVPAFLIAGVAVAFYFWGKTKIASLILGIPALVTLVITILTILIWVFLAMVMILFGK